MNDVLLGLNILHRQFLFLLTPLPSQAVTFIKGKGVCKLPDSSLEGERVDNEGRAGLISMHIQTTACEYLVELVLQVDLLIFILVSVLLAKFCPKPFVLNHRCVRS